MVTNSTIARNREDSNGANDAGTDLGGGISRKAGVVTLRNSIVVGNLRGTATAISDIDGTVATASLRNIVGHSGSTGGLQNGVNANIVGNNGTGSLSVTTVIDLTLTISGGKTPTHALVAHSPAIDSGANGLAVDQNGVPLAKDQRGITRTIDGDLNGSKIVDRGAVEIGVAPALSLGGSISYTEQAAAKLVAASATVTDVDSPNFGGGRLVVSIVGAGSGDRLAIRNQGNGPGQIGIASANNIWRKCNRRLQRWIGNRRAACQPDSGRDERGGRCSDSKCHFPTRLRSPTDGRSSNSIHTHRQ